MLASGLRGRVQWARATTRPRTLAAAGCGSPGSRGAAWLTPFKNQPFGLLVAIVGTLMIPCALWGHLRGRDLWLELLRIVGKRVLVADARGMGEEGPYWS